MHEFLFEVSCRRWKWGRKKNEDFCNVASSGYGVWAQVSLLIKQNQQFFVLSMRSDNKHSDEKKA